MVNATLRWQAATLIGRQVEDVDIGLIASVPDAGTNRDELALGQAAQGALHRALVDLAAARERLDGDLALVGGGATGGEHEQNQLVCVRVDLLPPRPADRAGIDPAHFGRQRLRAKPNLS